MAVFLPEESVYLLCDKIIRVKKQTPGAMPAGCGACCERQIDVVVP